MSSDFIKMMNEKDNREFMREQYRMIKLQRKEYKKNTWLLIISIIIAFASLIVSIIALYTLVSNKNGRIKKLIK